MSFFDAFIGGAADAGAGIINSQIQNDAALEKQKQFAQFNADLQEQKARTLEQLKVEMGNQQRIAEAGRINMAAQGIAQDQADASMVGHEVADPSTWTSEMEAARNQGKQGMIASAIKDPRTLSKAALQTGDYGHAASFDKMADSGTSTLKFGDQKIDSEGNVIAENDSLTKQQAELEKIRARNEGHAGKAVKPFDTAAQAKLAKETDDYLKGQGFGQEVMPNGIAPAKMDPAQKDVPDRVYNTRLRQLVSKAAEEAQATGYDAPLGKISETVNAKLASMRDTAAARTLQFAESQFGENGSKKPNAEALRKAFGANVPVGNVDDFKRFVYEKTFNDQLDVLSRQAEGKAAPQAAKKTEDAPKPVIASAKTAESGQTVNSNTPKPASSDNNALRDERIALLDRLKLKGIGQEQQMEIRLRISDIEAKLNRVSMFR